LYETFRERSIFVHQMNTPKDLRTAVNRLSLYCESLIGLLVMEPTELRAANQQHEFSQEELRNIQGLKQQIESNDIFWQVINRQYSVSQRTLQIFRITATLIFLDTARVANKQIESLQMIQMLLEKKFLIHDDLLEEFLILCVDLRTIVFAVYLASHGAFQNSPFG
jgi:hypothetical protein